MLRMLPFGLLIQWNSFAASRIPDVLLLLSKIPVLRSLQCVTAHAVPEETESGEDLAPQTLFAWINSQVALPAND